MEIQQNDLIKKIGKHLLALILFLGLVMVYFAPAVFDGKVIMQGDNIKAVGMGHSQMTQYAETAEPGEFSACTGDAFLFDRRPLAEDGRIYTCGDGFHRAGLFLSLDVRDGSQLVVGACGSDSVCFCFL